MINAYVGPNSHTPILLSLIWLFNENICFFISCSFIEIAFIIGLTVISNQILGWIWGSHRGGYEDFNLLGYNAEWSVEIQQTFRRNISHPPSESKNKPSKKPAWKQVARWLCLPPAFTLVSSLAWFSNLKMEAILSYDPTRHCIPEDRTLHNNLCENLKT
jgi:hypothetical protein